MKRERRARKDGITALLSMSHPRHTMALMFVPMRQAAKPIAVKKILATRERPTEKQFLLKHAKDEAC